MILRILNSNFLTNQNKSCFLIFFLEPMKFMKSRKLEYRGHKHNSYSQFHARLDFLLVKAGYVSYTLRSYTLQFLVQSCISQEGNDISRKMKNSLPSMTLTKSDKHFQLAYARSESSKSANHESQSRISFFCQFSSYSKFLSFR